MPWDVLSGEAKMAWDVLCGVAKTAWDVLSGWKSMWVVLSGVSKMARDVLSLDVLSYIRLLHLYYSFKVQNMSFLTFDSDKPPAHTSS